jgi:hypothetical protein
MQSFAASTSSSTANSSHSRSIALTCTTSTTVWSDSYTTALLLSDRTNAVAPASPEPADAALHIKP